MVPKPVGVPPPPPPADPYMAPPPAPSAIPSPLLSPANPPSPMLMRSLGSVSRPAPGPPSMVMPNTSMIVSYLFIRIHIFDINFNKLLVHYFLIIRMHFNFSRSHQSRLLHHPRLHLMSIFQPRPLLHPLRHQAVVPLSLTTSSWTYHALNQW